MKLIPLLLCIVATSTTLAQRASPPWPVILLDKPLHVGDDSNKEMHSPKPQASKFTAKFDLPSNIKPSVATSIFVTIEIGGMMPNSSKTGPDAIKSSKLMINGAEIAVLNKLVKGADSPKNVNKIAIRVPGKALVAGVNTLEIIPGATTHTLDDFEIHKVVIGSSAQ